MLGGYIGQFLPVAGGTMTGTLNMGGKSIVSLNLIKDNQATGRTRISVGGAAGTGDTILNDSTGASQIDISPGLVTIENSLTVDGTSLFNGSVEVDAAISAGAFHSLNYVGYQLLHVDGVNGFSGADGSEICPFQTIAQAIAAAVSGDVIKVAPGTYTENNTLPAGVALEGSGRGVTIIQNLTSYSPILRVSANCLVSKLTLLAGTSSQNGLCVDIVTSVITPDNVNFEDCEFAGNFDCINPGGAGSTSGATLSRWYFRNCHFRGPCWLYWDQTASPGITAEFLNCDFVQDNSIVRPDGLSQFGAVATAHGNVTVSGGAITAVTSLSSASLWATGAVIAGAGSITLSNVPITISAPSAPSTAIIAPFGNLGGATGTINIGDGVSYSSYSYFGTTSLAMPTVTYLNASQSLTVASSAVTPYWNRQGIQFDIAVDAATLSSDTLTINAPSPDAPGDGSKMRLRIKNTNASSTAMTLSLNSVYNVGSTSISTIAAGKRAYLDFAYDTDNSKWDLTGYASGL